ncbi:hypothetical protein [Pedobacter hartonius]|nr:hypothetical protein [Pedobacter hartonius]
MVRQASFSAIYVWIDQYNEGFESYVKKHILLTLSWACSNEELKIQLDLNNGDVNRVTRQLISGFKQDFKGNISYLEGVFDIETAQKMIQAIALYIKDTVETYAIVFSLSRNGKTSTG